MFKTPGLNQSAPRISGAATVEPQIATLQPVGFSDFLKMEMAPRDWLLEPLLPERSLGMLYAQRGLGKTFLSLSIGLAVAGGCSLMRWHAPKPRRVLLCDGEMPLVSLQERLKVISAGLAAKIPNDGFQVLAADACPHGLNISTEEGQAALAPLLQRIDLVIFDNISTLTNGSESSSDTWNQIQTWLLGLRRQGTSALLIHHSGKSGLSQRGTSKREDALDTVVALRRPNDYLPEQGCRFEVHFEKLRNRVDSDAAMSFEASYEDGQWTAKELQGPIDSRAAELFKNGLSVRAVSQKLSIPKSTAWRIRQSIGGLETVQ